MTDIFKRLIAITGGIGCGKSVCSEIFTKLGCQIVDTDKICHDLYQDIDSDLISKFIKRWGRDIIENNNLNRKKIADIVFNQLSELEWLNKTVHPLIYDKAFSMVDLSKTVIFDIPLLFETQQHTNFQNILCVWTSDEIQFNRLKERGWTDQEIKNRLSSQISKDKKLDLSTFGIINNGDIHFLSIQCKQIYNKIKGYKK